MNSFVNKSAGKAVKLHRDELDESQPAYCADMNDVSSNHISRFELGQSIRQERANQIMEKAGIENARNMFKSNGNGGGGRKKASSRPKTPKTKQHFEKQAHKTMEQLGRLESQNMLLRIGLCNIVCKELDVTPPQADKHIDMWLLMSGID